MVARIATGQRYDCREGARTRDNRIMNVAVRRASGLDAEVRQRAAQLRTCRRRRNRHQPCNAATGPSMKTRTLSSDDKASRRTWHDFGIDKLRNSPSK